MCTIIYKDSHKNCHCIKSIGKSLPIDKDGFCLLHSNNIEWKQDNKFQYWFSVLFKKLSTNDNVRVLDFENFVFVPTKEESRTNRFKEKYIGFNNFTFDKEANFKNTRFCGFADFSQSTFNKEVYFENANFQSANFDGSCFHKTEFKNSTFNGYADFQNCKFIGHAYFQNCTFNKRVYFHNSEFHSHTEFRGAEFYGQSNFVNVNFPKDWTIDFSKIIINSDAELIFKGASITNKLFKRCTKGKILFGIEESNILGKLTFIAVDLLKIREYEEILELSRHLSITIGDHCGSYFKILVKNLDERILQNIYKIFIESFNRFIQNEYNLAFNVSFKSLKNGFLVEFNSEKHISKSKFDEMHQKFKEEFEKKAFDIGKKDSTLKEFIKTNPNFSEEQESESILEITDADLTIDCNTILHKIKTYHEKGFFKKIKFPVKINLQLPFSDLLE